MAITHWKTLRISLLAVTLGGVLLVAGKSILYPSAAKQEGIVTFNFPDSVPLPEWQSLESKPLTITKTSDIKAGQQYSYQKNSLPLEIKIHYVVNTSGDVEGMMKNHTGLKSSPATLTVANIKGVGFYGLLQHENRAYLSTCINPNGGSTFTVEQFRYNRNTFDLQLSRIVPWLLGQGKLQDQRCLWTQMSIPLDRTTPTNANKILETAWVSWYQWWQPRFPQP
ncbi:MAG TPA: cyanoexosortase A system-associated protein [Kamptonema sp.]|nr:cyanoexosortase A system-associated protein [Kamptonema sp.]